MSHGGHRGSHGNHRAGGSFHFGSVLFGVFISPWIHRLMHRHKKKHRPVGARSPLWREISAIRVIHIVSAARVIGYLAMAIFVCYLVWVVAQIG